MTDIVVIGGGQAGLAMGYHLARRGRRFVILEAASEPAAAWRSRWDSLRLFTPARYDSLPGLPFPGDPDHYPGRDEVADYLTDYAARFALPVELGRRVEHVRRAGDGYAVELADRTYAARQVVVATGPFQVPVTPAFAAQLDPAVTHLHSVDYRRPSALPDGPVLVVGGGNTGFQIAEELAAAGREVHLSIGTRQTPLPQRLLGRDLFVWLERTRLMEKTVESRIGRKASRKETLVGSSARRLRRRGVALHDRAVGAAGRAVTFADGTELAPAAVVWATGFRFDHSWIDAPVFDADGRVVHTRGVTASPGLYFLGLPWQHTRGSALLGWVKDDAAYLADQIDAAGAPMPTTPQPSIPVPTVELADGETFDLRIAPVTKQLGDASVRMLAYNGSIPGPVLKVAQGSEVVVDVENQGDMEATVHWHGLRLDNRYDGTHDTQKPIEIGERFSYRLSFPDPGAYWYHPHIRQDRGQELGLYGTIIVEPSDPGYWPPVHRELSITLDDVLLEDGQVAPFSPDETTYAAMGRYGDQMLVNGEPHLALEATAGEVVRLYLVNTANTRVFNVAAPGAEMKRVGGDSGRVEHEELVESVVLAPSERVVVDVLFAAPGIAALEHRTPDHAYELATIAVADGAVDPGPTAAFATLRTDPELVAERERIARDRDREPDKTVSFVAEMEFEAPDGPVSYTCPMHPEVVSEAQGKCPHCGMKLMPMSADAPAAHEHDHGHDHDHDHHHDHDHDHHNDHAASDGIEWEDDMVEVNRTTTSANTRWRIEGETDWRFTVGDRVKIRLVNTMESDHPMHHPFHIHGAGRFLVLSRDGAEDPNLVWTDTVLVRTGETVDILLDVTEPGRWMAHCHIAEHHESGMMLTFDVAPASAAEGVR